MNGIGSLLWGVVGRESPESVNHQVARTLLDNLGHLGNTSSQRLATLCGVSKPTMSRFARELGFDDFYEFRLALEQDEPYRPSRWDVAGTEGPALSRFADATAANMGFLKDADIQEKVDQLAHDLRLYRKSYLVGHMQSGDAARTLYYHLHRSCAGATFLEGNKELKQAAAPLRDGSMLVIFSVTGSYLKIHGSVQGSLGKEPGSKVWLLTCDPYVREAEGVDAIINTGTGDNCAAGNLSLYALATAVALAFYSQD